MPLDKTSESDLTAALQIVIAKVRAIESRLDRMESDVRRHTGASQKVTTSNYPHPNITAIRRGAYTIVNETNDRDYDADASSVAELADVLSQVIGDLQSLGILG